MVGIYRHRGMNFLHLISMVLKNVIDPRQWEGDSLIDSRGKVIAIIYT